MSSSSIVQVGDNIYVNVTIGHDPSILHSSVAEYIETKTIPILNKCSDYYCSIIRFDIPLDEIPLFIIPILPNQTNPNLTPFTIGITYNGVDYPQNIIYNSENGYPVPDQNEPIQVVTPYYYVFEYQNLITAINKALSLAFISSGMSGNSPYFFLDNSNELINLVADISTFAPTLPTTPTATIFMNSSLQIYLSAFEVNFVGFNTNGKQYVFNLSRYGYNNTIPNPYTSNALQKVFVQEYSTLSLWSSLRKILITTNSIPIISEYTSANNSGVSATFPIISDFTPQIEQAGQNRSIAYYLPTAQYRLVDLKSNEQLNTIDLKIFWQDKAQNIYPLIISRFQQISIKIGFFKKSLYNNRIQ